TVDSIDELKTEIVAREKAETELRRLTDNLETQIRVRTQELEERNEQLRRSEAFLTDAQRLSSIGTYCWRVATGEITWSDELYRIFDLAPPLTLNRLRTRIHPEDISLYEKMVEEARCGGKDFEWQYRLLMPDHSVKYLHAVAHATQDEHGSLEYIAAVQDVTERRLSEEALANARSELEQVTRITWLGVLTAPIAHEVKQPLAAIVTNGESTLRLLGRDQPDIERVRVFTERVVADARRASEIIDRISDMARQKTPEQTLLSFGDVVDEALSFLRHELRLRGIGVTLDLARSLPQVVGDRTQLQQVIVNLVINAVQAMIPIDSADRIISLSARLSDPETVCCTIEDSGPGID